MTPKTDNSGMSKTTLWVIATLVSLVLALSSWGFTNVIGNLQTEIGNLKETIDKLDTTVEGLPTKIAELQGLDRLLEQRISRAEEDIKELKK